MTVVRASKLERYMLCAGFMDLVVEETEAGFPAKEGTAAGEYLQALLENKTPPTVASNGVYIDEDMKFYTGSVHYDIVRRAASQVLCETRIDWQTRSGIWIRGQYDASFEDTRGYLCIDDLKYGWGIVEAKENWQTLAYAIGEVIRRGKAYEYISLRIHQPRPHHEDGDSREWLISYAELLDYKEKIEARMQQLADGLRTLTTSPKGCKYCPGTQEACPAFSRLFYRAMEVTTEFHQDNLTNDEIARQLDQVKRAAEVIKIKADSLVELGSSRIKKGGMIPGYTTVENYGHRAWNTNVTPESIQLMTGVNVVEKSFMSPAKAEKAGVSKDLVKKLSKAPLVGVKLEKKNATDIGNKIFGTNNPIGVTS